MGSDRARQIKESLRLRDTMEFYGVRFNRRGFALCPFHVEKTASLSVKNERFTCFGCGAQGDVITFVMKYFDLDFRQAILKLDADFSLGLSYRKLDHRVRAQIAENRKIDEACKRIREERETEYRVLCQVHRILCSRYRNGEMWLGELVERLSELLDDFTGEEARAWKEIFK